ncbi:hypothetical protein BHE90_010705 [Fusarium euwallaceae]|uniref:Uncharacterized protein n=1 Tax=Fusarium euwallaceae TaxID=1147111 RepID=A0A430LGK6_9HYPO|nr:hypothetical protein BHE90_010705 [Fusarium euwallaceae]
MVKVASQISSCRISRSNIRPGLSCRQPHSELPISVTNFDIVVLTRSAAIPLTRVTVRRNFHSPNEFRLAQ